MYDSFGVDRLKRKIQEQEHSQVPAFHYSQLNTNRFGIITMVMKLKLMLIY